MLDERGTYRNQRGVALVAALLVLVFLSVVASGLIISMTTERKIAGLQARSDRALYTAEAGIAEALERIRKGDIPNNMNPKMVTQIFLAEPGNVPVKGADTTALPTWQEKKSWLNYSTSTPSSDVLTVTYKTDAKRTFIYKYDPTKNPSIQTGTGQPIFVVSSTGRVADAKRTLVTEVVETNIKTNLKAAVVAKKKVHVKEDSYYCGYNHSLATPSWINVPDGRNGNSNSCNKDLKKQIWELGSNDIVGLWSTGSIKDAKKAKSYGVPTGLQENQAGFYNGPWEVLGMSQAQFFALVGQPVSKPKKVKGELNGIVYWDADGKPDKDKGSVEIKGGEGEGMIYCEGDLKVKSDFTYRGLIYATGKIQFDGRAWVLGALVSEKDIHFHTSKKECAVLFSHDAIAKGIGMYAGPFTTLSWREKP